MREECPHCRKHYDEPTKISRITEVDMWMWVCRVIAVGMIGGLIALVTGGCIALTILALL